MRFSHYCPDPRMGGLSLDLSCHSFITLDLRDFFDDKGLPNVRNSLVVIVSLLIIKGVSLTVVKL